MQRLLYYTVQTKKAKENKGMAADEADDIG